MKKNEKAMVKKIPLDEIIFDIGFKKLENFKTEEVSLYQKEIDKKFTKIESKQYLPKKPNTADINYLFSNIRSWLINKNEDEVIQLQNDRFVYNWRKRSTEYNSYEDKRKDFIKYFDKFCTFYKTKELNFDLLQLSYRNHIDLDYFKSDFDLNKIDEIFPFLKIDSFKSVGKIQNYQQIIEIKTFQEDNVSLIIKIQYGTRNFDQKPLIIYEIIANCNYFENISLINYKNWFDIAHKSIREFFDKNKLINQNDK